MRAEVVDVRKQISVCDALFYITFGLIMIVTTMALSFNYIEISNLKGNVEEQNLLIMKKNVLIEALTTSCEMDYLIKKTHPNLIIKKMKVKNDPALPPLG